MIIEKGSLVRGWTKQGQEYSGVLLGILERTVSVETNKGERVLLMKDETLKEVKSISGYTMGERIKNLRRDAGMSQQKLADKLSVHNTAVSQWETGKALPPEQHLEALASTFGITAADLRGRAKAFNEVTVSYDPSKIKPKEDRENKDVEKTSVFASLQEKPLLREREILNDDGTFKGFRGPTPEMPKVAEVTPQVEEPLQADISVGHKQKDVDAPMIVRSEKEIEIAPVEERTTYPDSWSSKNPLTIKPSGTGVVYISTPGDRLLSETVLEQFLEQFLPAFNNFVIGHKVASALDCLLQRPHGMSLTDLKMAKDNLQQAIDYLERE